MNSADDFWLVDSSYLVRWAKEVLKSVNVYIPFELCIMNKVIAQDGPIELFGWILVGWEQLFSKVGKGGAQNV